MTTAQIMTAIQQKLNDRNKQFFTDTICLAAINTILAKLSGAYRFLGPETGTITTVPGTSIYAMPSAGASIGTIFELTQAPIYDGSVVLIVTDEDWLTRSDPLWTTWDNAQPRYAMLTRDGTRIRFVPTPDDAKDVTIIGPALHYTITNTADTPLLRVDLHPLLVYDGAIEAIGLIANSEEWAMRIPGLKDESAQYHAILNDARNGANRTRLIRGSRGGNPSLQEPIQVTAYPWSIPN